MSATFPFSDIRQRKKIVLRKDNMHHMEFIGSCGIPIIFHSNQVDYLVQSAPY